MFSGRTSGNALVNVEVNKKLKFVEQPIQIEDRKKTHLKNKILKLVKVRCNSRRDPECTQTGIEDDEEISTRVKLTFSTRFN